MGKSNSNRIIDKTEYLNDNVPGGHEGFHPFESVFIPLFKMVFLIFSTHTNSL